MGFRSRNRRSNVQTEMDEVTDWICVEIPYPDFSITGVQVDAYMRGLWQELGDWCRAYVGTPELIVTSEFGDCYWSEFAGDGWEGDFAKDSWRFWFRNGQDAMAFKLRFL